MSYASLPSVLDSFGISLLFDNSPSLDSSDPPEDSPDSPDPLDSPDAPFSSELFGDTLMPDCSEAPETNIETYKDRFTSV